MVNIGNFIFKATGIMTKKTILRKSSEIGTKVNDLAIKKGKEHLSEEEFQNILNNVLGEKAKKIKLVTKKEETVKEAQERLKISAETAESIYTQSSSLVLPKMNKDTVLLGLRVPELPQSAVGNISAHECEHALFESFSLRSKIIDLINKIPFIKKRGELVANSYGEIINVALTNLQNSMINLTGLGSPIGLTKSKGLLEHTQIASKERLHKFLQSILYGEKVLVLGNDKQNYILSNVIISTFKDEIRAYKAGGKAEQAFYKKAGIKTGGNATSSELRTELYNETVQILKKEKLRAKIKWIKTKLGLNPSRETENKAVQRYNRFQNALKEATKKKKEIAKIKEEEEFWNNAINYAG